MFIPIRINWRVLNLITIIQSGYITWQHSVSSHFIYYSIAQGNKEECLSIVLPGMFGSQGECVLSVRESVLFLMLYKPLRAQGPSQHTNTASRASDRTQRAVHLHKHCSVPFSTTHSMRQIQSDSPSVYTITGTAWMFREQSLERVPSAFVVVVRACQEGPVMPSGRRAHGAVTPNNGMSQLSAALSQFNGDDCCWAAGSCCQSQPELSTCSTWESGAGLRTPRLGHVHTKLCHSFSVGAGDLLHLLNCLKT